MCCNIIVPLNIILELAMLGVQGYAFSYNRHRYYQPIDITYLSVIPAFLVVSIVWLLCFPCIGRKCAKFVRVIRILQGLILLAVGSLMIVSERLISSSSGCQSYEKTWLQDCQLSIPKILAGAFALLDGILYFMGPVKSPSKAERQPLLKNSAQVSYEEDVPIAVAVEVPAELYGTVVRDGAGQIYQAPLANPTIIGFAPTYQQQPMANVPLGNQSYENPPSYFESMNSAENTSQTPAQPAQFYAPAQSTSLYPSLQSNYGAANQDFPTAPKQ